jgi:hypothetical protein
MKTDRDIVEILRGSLFLGHPLGWSSSSNTQQQEQVSSPSLESPRLLPSSSSEQQEVQIALSPSESCLSLSSSSNKPASNTADISRSFNKIGKLDLNLEKNLNCHKTFF